jgi:predicted nucleic acid-binding protein
LIVVSDTSPILNLSAIGRLDLLKSLYGVIVIPPFVHQELQHNGALVEAPWIKVIAAKGRADVARLREQLDPGEAEAIVLAGELGAELMLIDERKGRKVALDRGLRISGLLGVLAEAKQRGFIPNCRSLLDEMIGEAGFWIGRDLRARFLAEIGEADEQVH